MCLIPFSLFFIWRGCGWLIVWLFWAAGVACFGGNRLERLQNGRKKKLFLAGVICLLLFPLIGYKWGGLVAGEIVGSKALSVLAPLGISFYTLSLIGYCVDVFRVEISAERNPYRFLLFSSFFPQMVQGPIARFSKVSGTMFREQKFDYVEFCHGCQLILWGFFQKLVVADRLAILVDHVFAPERERTGFYIVIACLAYSFQLYTDFLGCVNIALGSAQLFGIQLEQNFRQPYFAVSVKEFWRRWHITLSGWLRDYIYIPLGGSRKGEGRKCLNLALTFLISGIWHGAGFHYFLWGLLHAGYQLAEEGWHILRERMGWKKNGTLPGKAAGTLLTFLAVTFGWALFRAENTAHFWHMMQNMFSVWNPEILLDGAAFELIGITRADIIPAVMGLVLVLGVDLMHERGCSIRNEIDRFWLPFRWGIYIGGVILVLFMGVYGPGYSAAQFIYGKF